MTSKGMERRGELAEERERGKTPGEFGDHWLGNLMVVVLLIKVRSTT